MDDCKIDWSMFDHVFCIHHLPFRDRMPRLEAELRRVDLLDSPNFSFEFTVPSFYDKVVFGATKSAGLNDLLTVGQLNLVLATYRILALSEAMGYGRILIMEDDVAFLKDKKEIVATLEMLPERYDICLFDKFAYAGLPTEEYESYLRDTVNERYARYDRLKSCGCYSLNGSFIPLLKAAYERRLMITDEYTSVFDFGRPVEKIFSIKNLCCQVSYAGCSNVHHGGRNCIHDAYARQRLDYGEYSVGDFGYGDLL